MSYKNLEDIPDLSKDQILNSARMRRLEICDCNGKYLKEGDYVMGSRGHTGSYLRKTFPEKIRMVYRIIWDKYHAKYRLKEVEIHREDRPYYEQGDYRNLPVFEVFNKVLDPKYPHIRCGRTYREDMVCEDVEYLDYEKYKNEID
jgi:hypothetical protein